MKICSIDGCETKRYANGLCEKHNRRVWRRGVPTLKYADDIGEDRLKSTDTHRECGMCHEMLPKADFNKYKQRNDKLHANCRNCMRLYRQSNMYGLPLEKLKAMILEADNKCSICQRHTDKFVIDHDHNCCPTLVGNKGLVCGKCVRGLICNGCNTGLGMFSDNLETIRRAYEYLENWQLSQGMRQDLPEAV